MKELRRSSLIILRMSVLTSRKAELAFFAFFFSLSGFFFHEYHDSQGTRGRGEAISLTPRYHFHPLYRRLDISQVIAQRAHLCA